MNEETLNLLKQLAHGIAIQFGPKCEVVVHDLRGEDAEHSIVAIENGHVTHRKVGDGPSMAVLEALCGNSENLHTDGSYLTKTKEGRLLKSTTIYIRDNKQQIVGLFSLNFDITELILANNAIDQLISITSKKEEASSIPHNVTELLQELIDESVRQIGKPVPLMTREDKIKAIKFLNDHGALLITKAGDKISKYFGISKYTLYSYIDSGNDDNLPV